MKYLFFLYFILFSFFFFSCDDSSNSSDIIDIQDFDEIEDISDATDAGTLDCSVRIAENVLIPMSDGAELAAVVFHSDNPECKLPTILIQTPYNKQNTVDSWLNSDDGSNPLFENTDYAVVVVDWRGFFESASNPDFQNGRTRGDDGFDTVEWIASQSWSNGKVATWGLSALGIIQFLTAEKQPPHLVAAVPIFSSLNKTYSSIYPGGVLRKEYNDFSKSYYGVDYSTHPLRDQSWIYLEKLHKPENMTVPMLIVAGWYDLDNGASFSTFDAISTATQSPASILHRMLIGNWIHQSLDGDNTSPYADFDHIIQTESLKFFNYYLRNQSNEATNWKKYRYITSSSSVIKESSVWPPSNAVETVYYLNSDKSLSLNPVSPGEVSFNYNPDDPVPSIGGQMLLPSLDHGPADQSSVLSDDDAVLFTTDILSSNITVFGQTVLRLEVSVTTVDADIAVRLVDIYPDGTAMLVTDGIKRLSMLNSYAFKTEVVPDEKMNIEVSLTNHTAYDFQAGHKIGFILSGSSYPRFARNPCNGDDFYTDSSSSQNSVITVYTDGISSVSIMNTISD